MQSTETILPIDASDEQLVAALDRAHIPSLMAALVHITGDSDLVRGEIRPHQAFFGDPQGGISAQDQALIRAQALQALKAFRNRGQKLPPSPSPDDIQDILNFMVGQEIPEDYVHFLTAELALNGEDPYMHAGLAEFDGRQKQAFKVIIIGAGMSGLLAAIRLQEAGIPFEIIERHGDVGGTWYQNTYPGCRVDSPNHSYAYSFRPNDWPQYFSKQEVLRKYFSDVADENGLRPHIRFRTEVTGARFQEGDGSWRVHVRGPDGEEELACNALISAVGQLNRPKWPDIPGQDRFKGIHFHSTQWQHQHDFSGKKVLVIGTGASAFQFAPEVAKEAAQVTIFQRTPPWMTPTPDYHADIPEQEHWLLNHVPFYARWFRFAMFWRTAEGVLAAARVDPAWNGQNNTISPANDMLRQMFSAWISEMVGDDQELMNKVTPRYPPAGKRILFDNGNWLRALKRDNVQLVTDTIVEITETGVRTEDGSEYDADILIYGTGFQADRFLWPMEIVGEGGVTLQEHWDGNPRAYLGITVPKFPNLFCLYGPNTNIVVNGSIVFFSECEVRYMLGCIHLLLERGKRTLACKQDVHDAYNEKIDAGNRQMAWGVADVSSWYKNKEGRVTQNWPFSMVEFWNQTHSPNPEDYRFG